MFRPDWENVVTPVVDFALKQTGVDPKRIVLMGISLGGVLAPRAAAFKKRLAALIANDGVYDFSAAFRSTVPPDKWEPFIHALKAESAPQVDQLLEGLAKQSPTVRWCRRMACGRPAQRRPAPSWPRRSITILGTA